MTTPQDPPEPGHRQPPDGQPAMGPLTTQFARIDPGPSQRYGLIGATVALLGAVLGVISFTGLDWFTGQATVGTLRFRQVHTLLGIVGAAPNVSGYATAYFSWLAWALLVIAAVIALLACAPSPASVLLRVLGAAFGLAGIAFTLLGIKLTTGPGYRTYLDHAGVGFYLALAAFVLLGAGALIGPRRS